MKYLIYILVLIIAFGSEAFDPTAPESEGLVAERELKKRKHKAPKAASATKAPKAASATKAPKAASATKAPSSNTKAPKDDKAAKAAKS